MINHPNKLNKEEKAINAIIEVGNITYSLIDSIDIY